MSGTVVLSPGETQQVVSEPPGITALIEGTGVFVTAPGADSTVTIGWTAAASVVTTPAGADGNWSVSIATLSQDYGSFANPALAGFGSAVALGVFGDPAIRVDGNGATDNVAVAFGSPVPAGNSFLLSAPGGTLISGNIHETGPYVFTFVALLNGVPVSTAGWSFAVETPSGGTPRWSYAIDAAAGTVTVTTINASVPGVDAVIVVTPDTPITNLSVTASTIPLDAWSLSVAPEAPCYVAGTRVATQAGEVAVEDLAAGDCLITVFAGAAPVRWVGHRLVDCRRHPDPASVWPVRICADAFGPGAPHADLLLSPDHAVFVHGALTPVKHLVNGATIAQEPRDFVHYCHVELERHDVLFAEGLACETYLDTGNRASFDNGGPAVALRPRFERSRLERRIWRSRACAPLVQHGKRLARIRRQLLERAVGFGYRMTSDPAVSIMVDGRAVWAEPEGCRWRVALPRGAGLVTIRSRRWVPAAMDPRADDRRCLGVAISGFWLDGRPVSLESAGLAEGWHDPEPGWRWTDGAGSLMLPPNTRELAFELAIAGTYWVESAELWRNVA